MSSLGERNCSGEAGATHCGGVEAFQPQEAVRNSHTAPATWPSQSQERMSMRKQGTCVQ